MKLKRIMAIVLCFAMVLSTMSFSVFAEDATTIVSNYDELVAALANVEAEKTIELSADITIDTKITIPDGVILDLKDNTLYVNVENSYYNNATIMNGDIVLGKDDVHVCDGYFLVNEGKTLVLNNVNMSSADGGIKGYAVFHLKTGASLDLIDSNLDIRDNEYSEGYIVYAGESTASVDVTGTTVYGTNVNGIVHATTVINNSTFTIDAVEHGINRSAATINDSTVTISGGTGRGITAQHGDLVISGNSVVNISDMGEATIELRDNKNLTVANTATVTVDVAVNNTTSGTITGDVTVDAATTPEAPKVIEIYDWEDLKELDARVEGGDMLEGVTVKLMNDINLYEMGEGGEPVTFNPIGANQAYFKGTFDGQGFAIKNMYQSGWALGYDWDNYGSIGLFAYLWDATVKNVTIENAECFVEGGNVAAIAGCAWGECTFENIMVKNSTFATYNNRAAGIIGYTGGEGTMTFNNVTVDEDTVIAALWGSYDCTLGGVVGSTQSPTQFHFEDVSVACKLDCYNDVTASYKWYSYRMCGMLIGRMGTLQEDAPTEVDPRGVVTLNNVNITIGEWANQTYIWDNSLSKGCQRVEPGYQYGGVNVEDYPDATTVETLGFNTIIGGPQSQSQGYYGSDITKLKALEGFDTSTLEVEDLAEIARNPVVAQIGDDKFGTLADAIAAATANDTITLLDAVIEDVTINKSITLDGADKNYTGTMTLNAANITIQNVNFVGGNIVKNAGSTANITIKGCDFDGQSSGSYAVELRNTGAIVIEDCTAKDYGYGFLQIPKSNNTISVKNVEISGVNYGLKIDYSNGVSLENVDITASVAGLLNSNYGAKTITIKDSKLSILSTWTRNNTTKTNIVFEGDNTVDEFVIDANIDVFKLAADATLTAPNTITVTTEEGYFVKYVDGAYKSVKAIAQIGNVKYESLAEAIAVGGDVILLADVENAGKIVVNKDVSLDLNGKTISGVCDEGQKYVFMVNNGVAMNIKDSSAEKTGKITYAGNNSTGWIINVEGNLVLESGTLELTGTWNIGYAVDVRPNAWGTAYTEETSFVMNGGKIISSDGAVRVASSSSDTYKDVSASFTMNGGEIEAAWDGVFVQQSNAAWDVLNVTINDGTIKSGLNPIRFYGPAATSYVNGEDCVAIALNGGTLTYTGTEAREWMVEGILRLGGGVTADDFMKDCDVTASETFAQANVADGYYWVSIGRKYRLQTLGEYSFVVEADKTEIVDSGNFVVSVKVSSEKVDNFHSTEYIVTYDPNLLTCAEDNGVYDYDSTTGTLRLQCLDGADVNEVIGTLNFTTKEFYLTHETEIKVSGIVCATQYDAAVGTSEPVSDGAVVVLLKDSFNVTVGAGLEGDAVAYNKTDYVVSVATENQGKQNTIKYTIKDADGNPVEYSVILPVGTNEYIISGNDIIGDMTFEISDTYSIEIITDYVTGYALILVDGSADGYTYNGHQMFKINRASGTFEYNGRYGWLVDGSAPGTTLESVEAAAYEAIRAGGESKAVETGYDVNSYINSDGKINFYDVSAAYACQKIDFALSDVDDYFYMELYLASDANCDGKVDSSDSAIISVNYN